MAEPGSGRDARWEVMNTAQTFDEILKVVRDARVRLVLVTPYIDLGAQDRIGNEVRAALARGVKVSIFLREDTRPARDPKWRDSIRSQIATGLRVFKVPGLHAKIYYSEARVVVASLNLLKSSVTGAIELGMRCSDAQGVANIRSFVEHEVNRLASPFDPDHEPLPSTSTSTSGRHAPRLREVAGAARAATKPPRRGSGPTHRLAVVDDDGDEDDDVCFRCGRSGHWASDCYARTDVDGEEIDDDDEWDED